MQSSQLITALLILLLAAVSVQNTNTVKNQVDTNASDINLLDK